MTVKRAFFGMIGVIVATALSIIGVVYFGNKLLTNQSNKLVELKAENEVLSNQEVSLAKAKQNVQKYKNLEELTQNVVPRDKDQAKATREIVELANASGIAIKTITFPSSNLGTKTTQPNNNEANQQNQETPQQPATNPISQAKPVQGIKGVYSLEANIIPSSKVNYYQFISFLEKLEKNRRTAQVTKVNIDPDGTSGNNSQISFTLTVNIFLKP